MPLWIYRYFVYWKGIVGKMILDGYFIVKFTEIGTSVLSVKINNLFERLMFIEEENAKKYMEKVNKNHDLCLYHTPAYSNNKVIYEKDEKMIDSISMDNLMVV